jgi:LysM repeat protein
MARILAVLALAAVVVALIIVIGDSTGSSDDPKKDGHRHGQKHEEQKPDQEAETYVVQPNDTLSAISQKTGVSVERLEQLNPQIDPQALPSGVTLKLR